MAGELRHGTVGAELTQAEWEALAAHAFDAQAIGDIPYASSATQLSRLAIGAADQVLKVVGGVPAWAAPAGSTTTPPRFLLYVPYETAARYTDTVDGGASVAYNTTGLRLNTSATGSSSAKNMYNSQNDLMITSPVLSFFVYPSIVGTDYEFLVAIIQTFTIDGPGGITYTTRHVGFKATRAASGTAAFRATQADATTENASASLFAPAGDDRIRCIAKINTTLSVDYYTQVNSGALSAATNLTSNMPTGSSVTSIGTGVSNKGVASATSWINGGSSFASP